MGRRVFLGICCSVLHPTLLLAAVDTTSSLTTKSASNGDLGVQRFFDDFPLSLPGSIEWRKNGETGVRSYGPLNTTLASAGSSLESVGFDFLDTWFSSKSNRVNRISEYVVSVLYAPPNSGLPPNYRVAAKEAFGDGKILYCDVVIFTGHDDYDVTWQAYDDYRISYAKKAPGVCLLNVHSNIRNGELTLAFPWASKPRWFFQIMERYRAGLVINELVAQGKIVNYNHGYPTLLYMDADAFPTNLYLTIDDVWDRFRVGIRHPTTETRLCANPENKYICHGLDPQPSNIAQIGYALGVETHCHKEYAVNSGVWFTRPSRLLTAILGATILSAEAKVKHKFDDGDQGYLNYALGNLFGYDYEFFQDMCQVFRLDYFTPALDPSISEIHVSRSLKVDAAKAHPVYGKFIQALFSPSPLLVSEPQYAMWTTPRWFNSYGCPWFLSNPARYVLAWHPGDFAVHYASCNHAGETSYFFRRQVCTYATEILPVPEEERDWNRWLAAGRLFWHVFFPDETYANPLNVTVPPFEIVPPESIVLPPLK